MNITLTLINTVNQKRVWSVIPSLWISFTTLTHVISVFCIRKYSTNSWHDSHKRIHFFVPPGIINSSTYHSTTLHIIKTSIVWGLIGAYTLSHPSVTVFLLYRRVIIVPTNRDYEKSKASLSTVMWPNTTVLRLCRSYLNPHFHHYKLLTSHSLRLNHM